MWVVHKMGGSGCGCVLHISFLCIMTLSLTTSVIYAGNRTHERVLGNGLKVLVKEDHRAPVITSQVWYRIGSSYEPDGLTGISHALEHMMFKGTAKYGPGQFSAVISANGGDDNAFTGRDYTAYFQNLAQDRLALALELEADRMRNLTLPAAEYVKEIEVVKEERRLRTEDSPTSLAVEQFYANAFILSPYRNPVIGWMTDLQSLTLEDMSHWYRRWYAPNNAILIVVGDVEAEQVFTLATRFFGPLQAEKITKPIARTEPPQKGTKRIQVKAKAKEPYLVMGYKTLGTDLTGQDWKPYALEMLAAVLDGGSSARFRRELVRGSEIASAVSADYSVFLRLPELFSIDGVPSQGHTIAELEQAIKLQIERIKNERVGPTELERVRNQLVASKVFEQDSLFYQAMELGFLESQGFDWRLADQYVARVSAITADQVQAVAQEFLNDDVLTIAVLEPQSMDGPAHADQSGVAHVIR